MNLCVIGTGYVGLVSGVCFAEAGNQVICVDVNQEKIKQLNAGIPTIFEPNLEKMLQRNLEQGRVSFTDDIQKGVLHADIIFLALPTPPGADGAADLSYVLQAASDLAPHLQSYKVIVNKSTVPVGTAAKVKAIVSSQTLVEFDVVSNPEFLREGSAVNDFLKPDRVIIGTSSVKAKDMMQELYQPFVRQGNPIIFMDEASSELTKYAANAFLATKITFMNEMANLAEKLGANVDMVRLGMGSDERIGRHFLYAGIGFGGSCFPKDVDALQSIAEEADYDFKMLRAVKQVNEEQRLSLIRKIRQFYKGQIAGKRFALWGLAFKPNTDDIREAPAMYMIEALLSAGASVTAYDPEAMANAQEKLGHQVQMAKDPYDALEHADALIIATEWANFRTPDFPLMLTKIKDKVIFDGRNLYDVHRMQMAGFSYYSVGRPHP
jgi:UDPglucose 6-dehydrogenase